MISEELLSEVLGRNVSKVSIPVIENSIHIEFDDVFSTFINIYELAHKCKEWAWDNYRISICSFKDVNGLWVVETEIDASIDYRYDNSFEADTEPEAIFKACEWIRKQND